MNREHLRAFLWLRWRLRYNQFRKAGPLNAAIFVAFAVFCLVASAGLFVVGGAAGLFAIRDAPASAHLFTWDAIVLALLFGWMIGLVSDLQRSEALSLERFLHLPVSPSGAFLVNYVSSLFNLTLVLFVPGMVGLILGTAAALGPLLLLELPLLAAALFALTALTYQFQGWLATLMANPRRRRTVIVLVTAVFVVVAQAPNLINVFRPWDRGPQLEAANRVTQEETAAAVRETNEAMAAAAKARAAGELPGDRYKARLDEIGRAHMARLDEISRRHQARLAEQFSVNWRRFEPAARLANLVFPPGWLPLGAERLAEGSVPPALLGTVGFTLIGTLSMWRAYRTTLRLYTGEYTAGNRKETTKAAAAPRDPARVRLVEWRLPWVSEHASAVATAAFRSVTRAPEAKMAFLAPLVMVVVGGGLMASARGDPPAFLRPLMVFGVGGMAVYFAGLQLLANQFGYDRTGFRAYVLSPAPRRDILLGKNLAVAPLLLGLGFAGVVVLGALYPMRVDHYPAVLTQVLSTFLIVCLLGNVVSILAPIPLAPGSLQPASVKFGPVLLHMLVMGSAPLFALPVLVPYALEVTLDQLDVVKGVPISLPLSVAVLAVVALVYRQVIRWQGDWLAARERAILEVVTSRAE